LWVQHDDAAEQGEYGGTESEFAGRAAPKATVVPLSPVQNGEDAERAKPDIGGGGGGEDGETGQQNADDIGISPFADRGKDGAQEIEQGEEEDTGAAKG